MTYFQHMKLSLYFSALLCWGSIQAFVHAFIPDIWITSTTDLNNEMKRILNNAGCR
jgi:hypothetical protein